MERTTYAELAQNSIVLVRELNGKRLKHKLNKLGLTSLVGNKGISVREVITNIKKPIGSIFEGSL